MKLLNISILVLLLFLNCSSDVDVQTDKTYTIETIEDVRHIHNHDPAWGNTTKVALEFVRQLGGLDETDENYWFFKPYDIAVDNEGNLYVLDMGNYRIQKYDAQGKFLATFGRKGEGPSEFQSPSGIDIDSEGNMYISDGPIKVLDAQGKEIKRLSCGRGHTGLLSSKEIVRNHSPYPGFDPKNWNMIHIYDNNGKLLREFVKPIIFEYSGFAPNGNLILFTIDQKDNIFACFITQNRIEKYSPEGKLLMRIDRPLDFKLKHKKKKVKLGSGRIVNSAEMMRVSEGIEVDHKGRIWVVTYRKQKTDEGPALFKFDIFDTEGIYLGSLPADEYKYTENIQKMKIHDDRFFIFDIFNEMVIYEYKIVEK